MLSADMGTRVVALANQKGGVGKTTTAINLAACLTALRKHVLLVDLDPQANTTSGFGLEKQKGGSIYHVLIGQETLDSKIKPSAYARLDLVPAEVDLAGAEIDVARSDNYLHRVQQALSPTVKQGAYDFIIIDCPPSLGILTMNALCAAHEILVPMQCEYYALEGLSVILRLVEELKSSGANPMLELEGIVMTMYDGRTNLAQQVVQEVFTHFGDKVYETMIPRSVRLGEAPSHGRPIIDYDPRSTGALAYKQLGHEFLKRRGMRGREDHAEPQRRPPASDPLPPPDEAEGSDDDTSEIAVLPPESAPAPNPSAPSSGLPEFY